MTAEKSPYGYYEGPLSDDLLQAAKSSLSKLPVWQLSPSGVLFPRPDRLAKKLRAARREFEKGVKLWTAEGRAKAARKKTCKK